MSKTISAKEFRPVAASVWYAGARSDRGYARCLVHWKNGTTSDLCTPIINAKPGDGNSQPGGHYLYSADVSGWSFDNADYFEVYIEETKNPDRLGEIRADISGYLKKWQ